MAHDRMFLEALEAIRLGKNSRARDLLTRLLRDDKDNELYWLYMSAVVDSQKEQVLCLENVLRIDPKNESAKRGMVLIGAKEPDEKIKPVRPKLLREIKLGDVHGMGAAKREAKRLPLGKLVGFGFVGLALVVLIYMGATGRLFEDRDAGRFTDVGGGAPPTSTATPTGTIVPTPEGGGPSFAGLDGPTPLASFLEATFTPTPLIVVTEHTNPLFDSGMASLGKGEYEQAIDFFEQALEVEVGAQDIQYYRGIAYLELGNNNKAKEIFSNIITQIPSFAPAYVGRARASIGLENFSTVTDDLGRALAHDDELVEAYVVRAEYFWSRGNTEAALEDALTALELDPANALAYHIAAKTYLELGQFEEALTAAQKCFELDITIIENYLTLGEALIENEQIAEAQQSLKTYLAFNEGTAVTWMLTGRTEQVVDNHEGALESFQKALDLDINLVEVSYWQGLSYLALEDYENAIDRLKNAVRIFPDWFGPQINYGKALLLSDEASAADGYFQINAATGKVKTDEDRAALYYWLALAFEALDDWDSATDYWDDMLALPPDVVPPEWRQTAALHKQGPTATPNPNIPTLEPSPTP